MDEPTHFQPNGQDGPCRRSIRSQDEGGRSTMGDMKRCPRLGRKVETEDDWLVAEKIAEPEVNHDDPTGVRERGKQKWENEPLVKVHGTCDLAG